MKFVLTLLTAAALPAAALPPMAAPTLAPLNRAHASFVRPNYRPLPADHVRRMVPRRIQRQNRYDAVIAKHARLFRVDARLIKAIIAVESSFNPDSVSKAGALGLMQVMPATGAGFGYDDDELRTVDGGIRAGTHQLAWLYKYMYGRMLGIYETGWVRSDEAPRWVHERVVLAYFAGHNNVRKGLVTPASRHYLRKVMSLYDHPEALVTPAQEPVWLSP